MAMRIGIVNSIFWNDGPQCMELEGIVVYFSYRSDWYTRLGFENRIVTVVDATLQTICRFCRGDAGESLNEKVWRCMDRIVCCRKGRTFDPVMNQEEREWQ